MDHTVHINGTTVHAASTHLGPAPIDWHLTNLAVVVRPLVAYAPTMQCVCHINPTGVITPRINLKGRNGRKYAEEHFSLEVCTSQIEDLLTQLAAS